MAYLLSSSKFSKTTGQIISVDGGSARSLPAIERTTNLDQKNCKSPIFITCLGDQFYTFHASKYDHILERLGVELIFPPEQTCCGQPLFNNGFEDKTAPVAMNFMHAFAKSDAPIIGPSGSCVSMVKHHYPSLFKEGTPEHHWQSILPLASLNSLNIWSMF